MFQIDPNITINYLLLGYGVMWLIGFGYVLSLATRQRNLKRDIALLRRLVQDE